MPPKKKARACAKPAPRRRKRTTEIDTAALIAALEQHILGEKDMTMTQVNAALALLKKIFPDGSLAPAKDAAHLSAHEEALRELE